MGKRQMPKQPMPKGGGGKKGGQMPPFMAPTKGGKKGGY